MPKDKKEKHSSGDKVEDGESEAAAVAAEAAAAVVLSPHPGDHSRRSANKETHWMLCADDSEASDRAFQHLLRLARHCPDDEKDDRITDTCHDWIHIVHVSPRIPHEVDVQAREYEAKARAENFLEPMRRQLREVHGLDRWQVEIVFGDPQDVIPDRLKAHGIDIIVTGSRGLSGIKKKLVGSFSAWLLRHAGVPVLVVH